MNTESRSERKLAPALIVSGLAVQFETSDEQQQF